MDKFYEAMKKAYDYNESEDIYVLSVSAVIDKFMDLNYPHHKYVLFVHAGEWHKINLNETDLNFSPAEDVEQILGRGLVGLMGAVRTNFVFTDAFLPKAERFIEQTCLVYLPQIGNEGLSFGDEAHT